MPQRTSSCVDPNTDVWQTEDGRTTGKSPLLTPRHELRGPLTQVGVPAWPWKTIARMTGVAAVIGLASLLIHPASATLLGYALATMWATGPLSPLMPGGYEAMTMAVGSVHPAWLVAAVGTAANLYVEFLNYHIYGAAVRHDRAQAIRENRVARWLRTVFDRRPFFAVWLCSWSPIPYWIVSVLAPLAGYPVGRFLFATLLGRFPRFLLIAALGAWWQVDAKLLLGFAAVTLAIGTALWIYRNRPRTASVLETRPQAAESWRLP